jgi:signal peptidase
MEERGQTLTEKRLLIGKALMAVMLSFVAVILVLYVYTIAIGGFAVVNGRSMEPLLHTGDLVFMKKGGSIEVGDIIVYKDRTGKFIIHRVVASYTYKGTKCYVTKGDNNPYPDTGYPGICRKPVHVEGGIGYGVPEDKVVGVVMGIGGNPVKIPYLGALTLVYKES